MSDSLQPHGTCSPPGSSANGILQARILEWVAMPSFRGSSQPRDRTHVSCGSPHWQAGSLPLVPPGRPSWQVAGLTGRWDRNWRQAGRRWIRFIRANILKPKGSTGKTSVGRWAWKFYSSVLLMPCFPHLFLPSGMTSGWNEGASALSGCLHIYKAHFHVWAYFILTTFCVPSCFSHVWLFATLWTVAHQTPLSMGFSRQE